MNEMWVGFISNAKLAELQAGNRCGQHGARTPEWMGLGSLSAQVKAEGRARATLRVLGFCFLTPSRLSLGGDDRCLAAHIIPSGNAV